MYLRCFSHRLTNGRIHPNASRTTDGWLSLTTSLRPPSASSERDLPQVDDLLGDPPLERLVERRSDALRQPVHLVVLQLHNRRTVLLQAEPQRLPLRLQVLNRLQPQDLRMTQEQSNALHQRVTARENLPLRLMVRLDDILEVMIQVLEVLLDGW